MSEILTELREFKSFPLTWESELNIFSLRMNAGFIGGGRSTISLFSIEITVAIVGLSAANSWTHRSPMCMNL